jgi:glycosyltransferase involved in cell wall biosynthesis
MACGTPVIAFKRGSMPELIDEGATGMIVGDVDSAVAAIKTVRTFDRAAIRSAAVERFGVDRMVDQYVAVYEQAIAQANLR